MVAAWQGRDKDPGPEREKLDQYFGTPEWYELLYERRQDLFGDDIVKVENSGQVLLEWYLKRLAQVFPFVSPARLIQSTSRHPLYYDETEWAFTMVRNTQLPHPCRTQ